MPNDDTVRIRIKMGQNEAEVEGPLTLIKELLDVIPQLSEKILLQNKASPISTDSAVAREAPAGELASATPVERFHVPEILIEKTDSLTDVISKIFRSQWARQPRRLNEIREALQTFGMPYPKQSVAVALLRLAQSGKLRRFKNESGEYVYTASLALVGSDSGNVNLAPLTSPS